MSNLLLSDDLRALASRLNEGRDPRTSHPENSAIYAMVGKAVALEGRIEALTPFLHHGPNCPSRGMPVGVQRRFADRFPCDCGLDTALQGKP